MLLPPLQQFLCLLLLQHQAGKLYNMQMLTNCSCQCALPQLTLWLAALSQQDEIAEGMCVAGNTRNDACWNSASAAWITITFALSDAFCRARPEAEHGNTVFQLMWDTVLSIHS